MVSWTNAKMSSNGTNSPLSMVVLNCWPRALPVATSARNKSPVDRCVKPNSLTMLAHCVLLPAPGPPSTKTMVRGVDSGTAMAAPLLTYCARVMPPGKVVDGREGAVTTTEDGAVGCCTTVAVAVCGATATEVPLPTGRDGLFCTNHSPNQRTASLPTGLALHNCTKPCTKTWFMVFFSVQAFSVK